MVTKNHRQFGNIGTIDLLILFVDIVVVKIFNRLLLS